MSNTHLTDRDIQQYVLQKSVCRPEIIDHLHHCEDCKQKARLYKLLIDGINQQQKPVFEFNLPDLVMPQLRPVRPVNAVHKAFVYGLVITALLLGSTVFYWAGSDLLRLFSAMTPMLNYLLLTTGGSLFVLLFLTMYVEFRMKMKRLYSS